MMKINALSFVLSLTFATGCAIASQEQSIHVQDKVGSAPVNELPKWIDRKEVLEYLNPTPGEIEESATPIPYKTVNLTIFQKEVDSGKIEGLKFPGGWTLNTQEDRGCLNRKIVLTSEDSSKKSITDIRTLRNDHFVSRVAKCLTGGDSEIQSIVVPNETYIAFKTSEPGWIFFDTQKGQFTGLVIETQGRDTKMFRNNIGEILLSYRDKKDGDEKGKSGENVLYRFGYFGPKRVK